MNKIHAVVVDLDGTLLNSEHIIHPDHKRTLIDLYRQGVHVLIASGRSIGTILPIWNQLDIEGPIIAYNGACMYSCKGPNITSTFESTLPPKVVERALEFGSQHKLFMNFYGKKTLEGYHPQGDYTWGKRYTKQTGAIYDFKTQESSNISRNDIIKILLICDPEKRSLLLEELQPSVQEEAQITCSNPEFIELLYKGQTKGSMLQTWCDSQGISPKDVAAFGDAENDYEMLSLVGHGIAAYNATPGLKKIHPRVSQWTNNQGFITKEIALIQSMETTH